MCQGAGHAQNQETCNLRRKEKLQVEAGLQSTKRTSRVGGETTVPRFIAQRAGDVAGTLQLFSQLCEVSCAIHLAEGLVTAFSILKNVRQVRSDHAGLTDCRYNFQQGIGPRCQPLVDLARLGVPAVRRVKDVNFNGCDVLLVSAAGHILTAAQHKQPRNPSRSLHLIQEPNNQEGSFQGGTAIW